MPAEVEMNVEVDASVILNGIKANKLNKDKDAKAAFADGVEDVTGGTVTNIDAKTVNTQRRSLMDEKATEVSFTVVLEELVDEGADYATVSETLLQSVKADLAASVEDATLEAALVNAAAASGSDVLADVGVDVEASVAAVEDATSTFEVTAVSETAGPTPKIDAGGPIDAELIDATPAPVASEGKKDNKLAKACRGITRASTCRDMGCKWTKHKKGRKVAKCEAWPFKKKGKKGKKGKKKNSKKTKKAKKGNL